MGALFLLLCFTAAGAENTKPAGSVETTLPPKQKLQLEEVLRQTLSRNGMIQEAVEDVEIARAQQKRAAAASFPKGEAILIGAPIFEEVGNAVSSTQNWSKWGPFVTGGVQVIQPLFTFGQISGYQKAAEHQINAKTELAEVKRFEVLQQAKEYWYGLQMAADLEKLVEGLVSFLEEAVNTAEEDAKNTKKKNAVKPHDLFKLKSALEDLRQKKLLASAGRQTAERAIAWVSGMNFGALEVAPSKSEPHEKRALAEYLDMAKKYRPEFRALQEGQRAREALRDAKQAQSYPTIFVGAFFSAGWSPVRTRQLSIYANDPFNRVNGGGGLGVRIDLEFWRHAAEAAEENAQAMKLKATESYAAPGIELQVKKAYWEYEQALKGLEIAEKRKALGKKWFVQSAMGWSIGLTAAKDLLESLEGDGTARKNYIETVYQLNVSLGRLSQAVGREITQLKYRD